MQRLNAAWGELCDLIIRPQRAEYDEFYLGPKVFRLGDRAFERTDVEVVNPRGLALKCSHFEPVPEERTADRLPCVVYLHGNCGCRLDSLEAVTLLLPSNVTVFALDFSGSGLSDGEYVSLGYFECQDLASVVDYLMSTKTVSRIGLWGRSMGAVTAIMYGSRDPSVTAIVADSPFSSLHRVMLELVRGYTSWIPQAATKLAIKFLRNAILQRAHFTIDDLDTVAFAKGCSMPILIGHARGDDFIRMHHSEAVFAAYAGPKTLARFEGDHNSERPPHYMMQVATFFTTLLWRIPGTNAIPANPPTQGSPVPDESVRTGSDAPGDDLTFSLDSVALTEGEHHIGGEAALAVAPDAPEGAVYRRDSRADRLTAETLEALLDAEDDDPLDSPIAMGENEISDANEDPADLSTEDVAFLPKGNQRELLTLEPTAVVTDRPPPSSPQNDRGSRDDTPHNTGTTDDAEEPTSTA